MRTSAIFCRLIEWDSNKSSLTFVFDLPQSGRPLQRCLLLCYWEGQRQRELLWKLQGKAIPNPNCQNLSGKDWIPRTSMSPHRDLNLTPVSDCESDEWVPRLSDSIRQDHWVLKVWPETWHTRAGLLDSCFMFIIWHFRAVDPCYFSWGTRLLLPGAQNYFSFFL